MGIFSADFERLVHLARDGKTREYEKLFMKLNQGSTELDAGAAINRIARTDLEGSMYGGSGGPKGYGGSTPGAGANEGKFIGWVEKLLETQEQQAPGARGEFLTAEKGIDSFFDEQGKFRGVLPSIGKIITDQLVVGLQQSTDLLTEMNTKAGMTGELSREFRQEIMEASPAVIRLGISFEEMKKSVSTVLADSGKLKLLGRDTIEEMALVSQFTESMEDLAQMGRGFEEIGLGVMDMAREIEAAGHNSLELGLNARTITEGIDENLRLLNQFGFKNGVEGLTRMVQKSVEFRMNMTDITTMAEKVWSPEGALEFVSNMQVIGGAMGDLNDPIKLMYMATNDIEGLQDAIIGASKSLVTYNNEQGRFEVTGANLRRAKAMADELGMSMGDLTKTAVASMERTQAASDLMARGIQMKPEDREFLTNLAQMREGRMVIEVPADLQKQLGGSTVALANMSAEQTKALLENREQFKVMTTEDITRRQYTAIQNIEHDLSYITAKARVGVGRELGQAIEEYISPNAGLALSLIHISEPTRPY